MDIKQTQAKLDAVFAKLSPEDQSLIQKAKESLDMAMEQFSKLSANGQKYYDIMSKLDLATASETTDDQNNPQDAIPSCQDETCGECPDCMAKGNGSNDMMQNFIGKY